MLKNQKQPGVKMIELFLFKVLTPQPKRETKIPVRGIKSTGIRKCYKEICTACSIAMEMHPAKRFNCNK